MYTELLHSYAHDRGHHIYFMFHDIGNTQDRKTLSLFYRTPSDFSETTEPFTNANVITFDGLHLGHWIRKNNLTVESESKGHLKEDKHYSREGNLLIANKVIEILKKDNVIDG